jgi:sulfhydrogenase subunit beta (sulfur reductase)
MKLLTQGQLNEWLDRIATSYSLVAPVNTEGKLLYRPVRTHDEIEWGFQRTDMSPKEWLFPATEPILTVEQGTETRLEDAPAPVPTVLFGVRPCDARGALAIDALFLDKPPADGQYARHRESATLIGLACPQMWDTCFCTVVGGAPDSTEGLDILLTELQGKDGAEYAAQVLSEKGGRLAADMPGNEKPAALPEPRLSEGLPTLQSSAEWKQRFNDALWKQVTDRCLACRACTFVCPTCRCFDVRDEVVSRQPGRQVVQRLRAWDACTAEPYRRIAGGHNPRPNPHSRLRNRFYCKFVYYPDDFGPLGCVGCGRCIDACPVNIDILEVIGRVEQLAAQPSQ